MKQYHPYRGHTALFYLVPEEVLPKRPISRSIILSLLEARTEHLYRHIFGGVSRKNRLSNCEHCVRGGE